MTVFSPEHISPLITAFAALITALVAAWKVFTATSKTARRVAVLAQKIETLETENRVLSQSVERLKAENLILSEENRKLSARLVATLRKNEEQRQRNRDLDQVNEQYRKDLATVIAKLNSQSDTGL